MQSQVECDMPEPDDSMIRGVVRVVAINGDKALVISENQAACGGCTVSKGCGTKAITEYFGKKMAPFEMDNNFNAVVNKRLEVGLSNSTILKVSALIYMLPLAGLFLGAMLGAALNSGDIIPMGFSLVGLAIGFYMTKSLYISKRFAAAVVPVFLRQLEPLKEGELDQGDLIPAIRISP